MKVELSPYTGVKPVMIYGFPTTGKSSAQRVFRYLSGAAKERLGMPSDIHFDFTDTDLYLGVFKIHVQDDIDASLIKENIWKSLALTSKLKVKEGHLSVTFTNFNDPGDFCRLDDVNFLCGFVPESEDSMLANLARRSQTEYKESKERFIGFFRRMKESPLYKYLDQRGKLVTLGAGEHILDYLAYEGVTPPFVDVHIKPEEVDKHSFL